MHKAKRLNRAVEVRQHGWEKHLGGVARFGGVVGLLVAALLACGGGSGEGTADGGQVESGQAPRTGARVALVIGNAAYRRSESITGLENPVRDARLLKKALEGAGFTVTLKPDVGRNAFLDALTDFGKVARSAAAALFYYAGHAVTEDGENYLIPVDMEDLESVGDHAVSVARVLRELRGIQNLVFLDSCRTPPERGLRGDWDEDPLGRGLAAVGTGAERQYLIGFAAAPGSPALDGEAGRNSPYATALAAHLGTSGLPVTQMLMRVRNEVSAATDKKQVPWQNNSLAEDFYFVPTESVDPPRPSKVKPDSETPGGGGTAVVTPPSVVLPEWERECERILGIEDPARAVTVRAYVKKYRGEPAAAVCVADAQVLAGKLEKQAQQPPSPPRPPPVVSGTGAGATGSGTPRRRAGEVWESPSGMEFAWIPAGTFVMGSPEGEEGRFDDERQHEVRISRGFWMGRYEVTQGEWEGVMGTNPSYFDDCGSRCPVEEVSWEDVQGFIGKLNGRESGRGYRYRLPTEAEWEYAARAGTVGARHGELGDVAWWAGSSGGTTHPVGEKRANGWGLHDMLGNVWEWTADWRGAYPSGSVTDPAGPRAGSARVSRGGSWYSLARDVRSAGRGNNAPGARDGIGFRLVRTD